MICTPVCAAGFFRRRSSRAWRNAAAGEAKGFSRVPGLRSLPSGETQSSADDWPAAIETHPAATKADSHRCQNVFMRRESKFWQSRFQPFDFQRERVAAGRFRGQLNLESVGVVLPARLAAASEQANATDSAGDIRSVGGE